MAGCDGDRGTATCGHDECPPAASGRAAGRYFSRMPARRRGVGGFLPATGGASVRHGRRCRRAGIRTRCAVRAVGRFGVLVFGKALRGQAFLRGDTWPERPAGPASRLDS
ncbi:hypothetical protein P355_0663 [Burkholderia cenocepacia KC-01]|nr:hypothetical protein P355_0663 [Burkholderia cenocepacia KC-01]